MGKMKDLFNEDVEVDVTGVEVTTTPVETDSALEAFMREPGEQAGTVEVTTTPVEVELTDEELGEQVAERMASVAQNAKLVRLTMTGYKPTTQDKEVAKEIAKNKNATEKAVIAHVNLLPNLTQLDQLNNFCSALRKENNARTVPYEDRGRRLVPSLGEMFKHWAWQKEVRKEFEDLKKKLADEYDNYLTKTHLELGALYDPSKYLTKEQVLNKFTLEFYEEDLPKGELTVRIDENATDEVVAMVKEAKAKARTSTLARFDSINTSVFVELLDPLCNMIHQLRDENHDGTEHGFNDNSGDPIKPQYKRTLIDNVMKEINTIEQWFETMGDLGGSDTQAADHVIRLASNFRNVDTDALKEDDLLRIRIRNYALDMLRAVPRKAIDANREAALKQQQKLKNGKDAPAKNRIDLLDAI